MASSCDCLHMKCVMSRCVLPPYCVNWLSPLAFGSTHMPLGWFFFSNVFFPMWNHKDEWCVKCIWSDRVAVHSQKSVKLHWGTVTLLLIFMGWLRSHKFLEVLEDDIGKSYHIYIYMSAWSGVPVSSWIPSRERRGHARSELCSGGLGCLGGLFKSKVSMSLEEASCLQHLTTNYVGILCKIAVEACQRKADLLQACFKLGRPLLHQNLDVRHVPEQ